MSVAPGPYLCAQVYVGHRWHSIPNIVDDLQISSVPASTILFPAEYGRKGHMASSFGTERANNTADPVF